MPGTPIMGLAAGLSQKRLITVLGLCLTLAFLWGFAAPTWQPAYGQGDPPADGGGAASTPADSSGGARTSSQRPNLFWHIVKSAGIVFGPLLLLISIGLVALIVLLAMDLRMGVAIPPGFVEEFTDTVNKRKFKEAFDLARNDSSYVARVL